MTESRAARRVALITGATRGIGLETCRQLLTRGYRVVMTGRSAERALAAAREVGAAPDEIVAIEMDIDDPVSVAEAHRKVTEQIGAVDVVVNNAAILVHEDRSVLEIPRDAFRRSFETNVLGAIDVCRAFAPAMVERRYGRIVNVSSGAGQLSDSTYAPAYSLSKVALNAFTRILAETYRGTGVLVNCVDPGWVRTDMGGPHAPRSVEQGAETIVWLCTLPDNGPTGGFFRDRRPIPW